MLHPTTILNEINSDLFLKGYDADAGCIVRTRNKTYNESIICSNKHAELIIKVLDKLGIPYVSLPGERKPSRTSIALENPEDINRIHENLELFEAIK